MFFIVNEGQTSMVGENGKNGKNLYQHGIGKVNVYIGLANYM